ncbi:transporter [Endobacter medicaginis]|jgi:Putative MetA-pathway of phenol degradation|nr:transporter [Endobacter medicaginis]
MNYSLSAASCVRRWLVPLCLMATIVIGTPARAADLDADDYSAGGLPAGTNLALLYFQHAVRDQYNAFGNKAGRGDLTSDIGILRYAHFVDVGPFIADPQFLLPFGSLHGSGDQRALGSASGIGDLILASTFWLYRDKVAGRYFGVTPFIYAPTGQYNRNQPLSLGENRWKFTLQTAYVTPLFTPKLTMQVSADVTFYTHNSSYGAASQTLTQKPLGEFQEWFMYHVNKDLDIRAGTFQFVGGTQFVDGQRVRNSHTSTVNFKVGFGWNFAPTWSLVGLYGRDAHVENGFEESTRFNFRVLKAF